MQITNDAIKNILTRIKNVKDRTTNVPYYVTTSGSGSAYTVTIPGLDNYYDGLTLIINPHVNNTDNATININSMGEQNIKINGINVKSNEIKAGTPVQLVRVGSSFFITSQKQSQKNELNVYISQEQPEEKDGIWVKTDGVISDIVDGKPKFEGINEISNIPFEFIFGGICNIGNYIYLFGGLPTISNRAAYRYSITNNYYAELDPIPYDFISGSVIAYDHYIYLIGGSYSSNTLCVYDTCKCTYSYKKDIPFKFYSGSCCLHGTSIYIFGGASENTTAYRYDIEKDEYQKITKTPMPFYESQVICNSDYIYLLGSKSSSYYKTVYKYSITDDTYSQITDLPYIFYNGSAVFSDNCIYLIGGSYDDSTLKYFYKWNLEDDSFNKIFNLPYDFYGGGAIYYDDIIYVFGGAKQSKKSYTIGLAKEEYNYYTDINCEFRRGSIVSDNKNEIYLLGGSGTTNKNGFYLYDTITQTTTQLINLPIKFYRGAACIIENCIYIFGSFDSNYSNVAYRYDIDESTFVRLADIPFAFELGQCINIGHKIYLANGTDYNDLYYMCVYDIKLNSYYYVSDIPYNFCGGTLCRMNNYIYLFGSSDQEYNTTAYKYNTESDEYTQISDIPYSLSFGSAVAIHENIYLIGSSVSGNCNLIYRYNTLTDKYTRGNNLPSNFYNGGCVRINNDICIVGGDTIPNSIYSLCIKYPYKNVLFIYSNKEPIYSTNLYNAKYLSMNKKKFSQCIYINSESKEDYCSKYIGDSTAWSLIDPEIHDIITPSYNDYSIYVHLNSTYSYSYDNDSEVQANLYNPNIINLKSTTIKSTEDIVDYEPKNKVQITSNYRNIFTNEPVKITFKCLNDNIKYIITPESYNNIISGYKEFTYIARQNGKYTFIIVDTNNNAIEKVIEVSGINILDRKEYYINNYILTSDPSSITDADQSVIDERLSIIRERLPDKLIDYLIEDDYRIIFVPSNKPLNEFMLEVIPGSTKIADGIGGVTYYLRKEIYLTCDSKKPQTTMHEIGHAIDRYYYIHLGGYISERDDYKAIYDSKTDYSTIFSSDVYFLQSVSEYFAQNFAYYFTPMSLNPMEIDGPKNKEYFDKLNDEEWSKQ